MKQIQNVTPGNAGNPGMPGKAPVAPTRRLGVLLGAFVIGMFLFYAIFHVLHRENRYEKLADGVTKAIAANNMSRIERRFNALRRPQLEDRGKVGRLSDFVNAHGAFKRTKEDTPKDAQPGYHHFIAEFEKGNLSEDLTVDGEGKIADFHVRPLDSQ